MNVDFDAYPYYPSLRTRLWEMRGYKELGPLEKDKLLPIVVLSSHGRTKSIEDVSMKVDDALEGRPRIIDLEQSPIYSCDEYPSLSDPSKGFAAWRKFVAGQNNAIPTALLPSGGPLRDIVRQVILLENEVGQIVVRSRSPQTDIPVLSAIMSAVDDVNNLLLVLDFGYVRSRANALAIEAANAINSLRTIDEAVRIVVIGSSYPKSAATYDDAGAAIPIQERAMHAALGGNAVAIYGDYGSIHPEPIEPMKQRFVPRIDYPLSDAWIFRRVREDQGGYPACAKKITNLADWDSTLVGAVWGATKIDDAARGNIAKMGQPGPWIAVRVNLHLWQQLHYGNDTETVEDEDIFD
ncbi:hypothetical protein ACFOW6_15685 [Fodinicurvata halophila]|uniref:T4 beta protein n=1 Tax=Fodinicurvata halophila TaxID=1419723 RepID=A0ABV8UQJ0_9PROT